MLRSAEGGYNQDNYGIFALFIFLSVTTVTATCCAHYVIIALFYLSTPQDTAVGQSIYHLGN